MNKNSIKTANILGLIGMFIILIALILLIFTSNLYLFLTIIIIGGVLLHISNTMLRRMRDYFHLNNFKD